jgi:hypothetical protein
MDGGYLECPGSAGEVRLLRPLIWLIGRLAAADCTR